MGKIYEKLTANDSNLILVIWKKLVDEYNNTYHFISKKPVGTDYSVLTGEIELSHKVPKFKVRNRIRITNYIQEYFQEYITRIYSWDFYGQIILIHPNHILQLYGVTI